MKGLVCHLRSLQFYYYYYFKRYGAPGSLKGFQVGREEQRGRERKFDMVRFRFYGNGSDCSMKNILEKSKSRGKETLQETLTVFSNFSVHHSHLRSCLNTGCCALSSEEFCIQ